MNGVADHLLGESGGERSHVLRSATSSADRTVSAELDIIDLDLGSKHAGPLHQPQYSQDLGVLQPGRVVVHTQVASELKRGDGSRKLANE